jgi:hypothetical protein
LYKALLLPNGSHRTQPGPALQLLRKLLNTLDRLGCFSFLSALASICRIRSRVNENGCPTSSRVWSLFMPRPKRMRTMRSSRGVSEANTRVVVSRRFDWIAASIGRMAFLSSTKSPRWESPSSRWCHPHSAPIHRGRVSWHHYAKTGP